MLAAAAQAEAAERESTRWGLADGDEIVPGRHALRRLGGGHRYEAYLAWDDRLHSLVVAKVVRPHLVEDGHTLEGLLGEAEVLSRVNHPVLLRSFDAVLEGPRPHLVLEHLEGPRLSTLVRRYGPLPPEQLLPLALQLSAALHYLRELRIVHLDVKPANVIMGAPPRLIDMSVARSVGDAAHLDQPVGTDSYMAPEQCQPAERGPVGPAADVFGLGATLYRAATGEKPFPGAVPESDVPQQRWPQLVNGPGPLADRVSAPVAETILACLQHAPRMRPVPAEVARRLEPVLEELPRPRLSKLKPRWR